MAGNITVTLTGDEARLLRALDRVIAKEQEVGEAGKDAARKTKSGFEEVDKSITNVVKSVAEFGLVAAVFTAAAGSARELKQGIDGIADSLKAVKEAAAEQGRQEGGSFGKLAQLGGDYGAGVTLAKRLKDQGGLSEGDSTSAIFGLKRAGLLSSSGADVAIQAARLGLGPDAVGSAAAAQKSMGMSATPESVQRLLAHAAAVSPGNAVDTLGSMAHQGAAAKHLGISEDELLVAQSQLAAKSASPERASKAMHQLLESFGKNRVHGGSLAEMIASQQGRHGSEKHLSERFGPQGLEALRALDPAALRAGVAGLGSGDLGGMVAGMGEDSGVATFLAERDARAEEARQREPLGQGKMLRETRRARERIAGRRAGRDEAGVLSDEARKDYNAGSFFGIPNALAPDPVHGDSNAGDATRGVLSTFELLEKHAAETAANTRRSADNSRIPMSDPKRDK